MRVLVINLDKKIFEPNSTSLKRLKLYADFCEKLEVVVLTLQKFEPIKIGNLEIYATGSGSRLKYFFDARRLIKKIMGREKMDLVMTQDPFETGLIGYLTKKKYGLPWQCQIHGDVFSPCFARESLVNKFRVWLAKFLLPRADGIRAVSERIKNSLLAKFSNLKSQITVLPIFVDTTALQSEPIQMNLKEKYPQFDFIALMASRLSTEKNIGLAIRALSEIVIKFPKTGLIIVGDGKEKSKLESLVRTHKLDKNVIFEPWTPELSSHYKTANAFLLTSNYEGWGLTVVEAVACASPIIMTDVGCAGEFIKNGESGLVVPVGDKDVLVSAVEKLITDKNLAQQLAQNAQKTALSLPSQAEYLNLYKKSFSSLI